jgi:GT2 family glycosyltransferase
MLTDDNLWNRANSAAMFLRSEVVRRVGPFDDRLGVGSDQVWSSAEEIDYLIRAIHLGARIEYDPSFVVEHEVRADDARIGLRDGASVGYLLRKHRYSARMVARMIVRPVGGVIVSLARFDRSRASYWAATFRGRVRGYRDASPSKIST